MFSLLAFGAIKMYERWSDEKLQEQAMRFAGIVRELETLQLALGKLSDDANHHKLQAGALSGHVEFLGNDPTLGEGLSDEVFQLLAPKMLAEFIASVTRLAQDTFAPAEERSGSQGGLKGLVAGVAVGATAAALALKSCSPHAGA